jgi:Xaa-Pro aminopeptidase
MVYMMGGGHLTQAVLIKKAGQDPILYCEPMERDEAAASGLKSTPFTKFPWKDLMEKAGNDPVTARALQYGCILEDAGINSGKVVLYGQVDLGKGYATFNRLQEMYPNIELIGYMDKDILKQTMATKGPDEIYRIKKMGDVTVEVVSRTAEYMRGQKLKNNILVDREGQPLTIGDVKSKINLWLADLGGENPEGTIFSIGRDSAVPHSSGNPGDYLKGGETIVFDIFPCEFGGGYYYDFTRTWCLGYASDEVLSIYEQVYDVYHSVVNELKPGELFSRYQGLTCALFEKNGHQTISTNPASEQGYVHSIGHGLGLNVHEMPFSGMSASARETLEPGSVFTIEPGLYYPDKGIGVRLEDTYWMGQNGKSNRFVDYPMDLVLPVKV